MQKITYLLLSLCCCISVSFAQAQDWQWAKRGGGVQSLNSGSEVFSTGRERVLEVAVDSQNNYYFIAEIGSSNATYDGESVTTYGDDGGRKNIFIFSTTCDGDFRWKKTIGGGFHDLANSIKIDTNDNVYVTGKTINLSNHTPVHFDTDSIKNPAPQSGTLTESFKGAFVIKYNKDGDFQWLVEPEGAVSSAFNSAVMAMDIDDNNNIHTLLYLVTGTHLDGQVEVEEDDSQTAIAKFDEDGILLDYTLIDLQPGTNAPYDYQMVYDSNLDRYYIADTKRNSSDVISINGFGDDSSLTNSFYLSAIDNQGNVLWFHDNNINGSWTLGDIKLDNNGDIYFTGAAHSSSSINDSFNGFDFEFLGSSGITVPFLVKLDSDGNLIWGSNGGFSGRFPGRSIAIHGNDVYLGLGMYYNEWDGIVIPGIQGGGQVPDPTLLRFNATTGSLDEVIRMPDNTVGQDEIMSIALDHNQNIIMGGHFSSTLLSNHPVETLQKAGGASDFFIAKYGTDVCTLSTTDFNIETHIQLYPNPARNQVYLSSELSLVKAEVYNIQGKKVKEVQLQNSNPSINIQALKTGLYLVKITTQDGQQTTKKLIVK